MSNSQQIFNNKYPDFWHVVKPHTYGPYVMDFDSNKFESITKIIKDNMHYFNIENLIQIDSYLTDLIGYLSGNNEEGFNEVLRFSWELDDLLIEKKRQKKELLDIITPKISKYHFTDGILNNPLMIFNIHVEDGEDDYTSLHVLMELRKETLKYIYYLMLFVYDLTLRMQKIKSEIIKYELTLLNTNEYVCNVLSVLMNELLLEYTILNKDFIIYNNKLSKIENYGEYLYLWPILWPNNLHIMNDYYNKSFDFGEKEFDSVMNELESE